MLLFMDTESDPITKQPLSIQYAYGDNIGIITEFTSDTWSAIAHMWQSADGVVMFNAPYDLGVLSVAFPQNSYEWVTNQRGKHWKITVFGNVYQVRRISGFRNTIRPLSSVSSADGEIYRKDKKRPKSTPVIDLLKLWSILIDDSGRSISLKALISRELKKPVIEYSPETSQTTEYRLQDVVCLRDLWQVFLEKVSSIDVVAGYTPAEWGAIASQATFSKIAYQREYSEIRKMQERNTETDRKHKLRGALEQAYNGGITIAFRRGLAEPTAWFDIHGSYAGVIACENTDRYLVYDWEPVDDIDRPLVRDGEPHLCKCVTDTIMKNINSSLKVYRLNRARPMWYWSYDILALQTMFPDAGFRIERRYRLVPGLDVDESLPARWARFKEEEERLHGKTTLRNFYKFLSNTSYGIKAQRNPFPTIHTNLALAGVITSRAHLTLIEMADEAMRAGCRWIYSDTDSICVEYTDEMDIAELERRINKRIAPYSAGCEGYDMTTRILSLKRYVSRGGRNLDGTPAADKIRVHGKSQYNVNSKDILAWVEGTRVPSQKPMKLASIAGNTERTLRRVIALNPLAERYAHPFMFETSVSSNISAFEWFKRWYNHLDTKTTYIDDAPAGATFERYFRRFDSEYEALRFWRAKVDKDGADVWIPEKDYDTVDMVFFGQLDR